MDVRDILMKLHPRFDYRAMSGPTWVWKTCDNVVVDAIKLILINYSKFGIAKMVATKIERVKSTLSRLPTNMKLIFDKLIFIKNYTKGVNQIKIRNNIGKR